MEEKNVKTKAAKAEKKVVDPLLAGCLIASAFVIVEIVTLIVILPIL